MKGRFVLVGRVNGFGVFVRSSSHITDVDLTGGRI